MGLVETLTPVQSSGGLLKIILFLILRQQNSSEKNLKEKEFKT